jgi:dethiobiotin synthetase
MDRLVTKTLAEIYLQQGHFEEAYSLFKTLSERDPEDIELKHRLKELEEKVNLLRLKESISPALKKIQNLEKWLNNIRERRKP